MSLATTFAELRAQSRVAHVSMLRDHFAGQALAGYGEAHHRIAQAIGPVDDAPLAIANAAYAIADAMLKAREMPERER